MFSITALAIALLLNGRLDEVDELLGDLVEHFRVDGPPTALQYALTWLGTTASIRGRHEESLQLFGDAALVDVPPGTHTLKNPLEAQAALRRGDEARAFELLRDYVQELIDNDNTYVAKTTAVTFVEVMVETGHMAEAARIMGFLEASGSMDVPAWRGLLGDAARRVEDALETGNERERGRKLNDRTALAGMRDILLELRSMADGLDR